MENNTFIDYKDVLLFDKTIKDTLVIAKVPFSRFKIILSGYVALSCAGIDVERMTVLYDDYIISGINENGNAYKIIKAYSRDEEENQYDTCDCEERRPKLSTHDKCFYCQRITKDYTTRINPEEDARLSKLNKAKERRVAEEKAKETNRRTRY